VADAPGSLHGFPASLTSFVGRARATHQIAAKLAECRLVTLTGPGGAGKTRLVGEVARQVAGRFADGVWLAELAAVRDPAQVPAAVAAALGIHDLPAVAVSDALAHALAQRQLLLVLDNCEQVIGAAAEVCGRLLLGADDVRVLATSREPLRIAGEVRYRLGPLSLPDPGQPGNPDDPAGSGAESEAVTLFADRARRAEPGFTLDAQTRKTVDQLVARLDGMPLAIELAARVDALGVPQLLDRIDDRFALLVDGDRLVDCSLLVPPRAGPDGRIRYTMLETLRAYGTGLLAEAGEDDQAAAALAGYVAELAEQTSAGLHTSTQEAASLRLFDADRHADRAAAHHPGQPGLLRPPVRGHRAPGRGDHGVGGGVRAQRSLAASVRHQEPGRAGGTPAERERTARPGRGPGGRGTRRGHERGHRRRVRPPARRGPAASGAAATAVPGSAQAQPAGA